MLACRSDLKINAITTVFGNSIVENSTRNALAILDLVGKRIPVYEGMDKPISGQAVNAKSHGDNGLGGFEKTTMLKKENKSANDCLSEMLAKSKKQISLNNLYRTVFKIFAIF
ncbi:hypothetical protein A3D05_05805 [Candidatus Gottesmanbacteria bacterium RIFCSPHIGHO2_02_FULL_40_24]|uniref:Inosine/uridine-preferring nucleoside hydrolase domain-containing protein n=1 Tax=Candidatus Gottesmanbacteria bacterium RIFCSPHIGHO2_01_FULL_40_15 TaxID=1798376 RepID=A0A1F5Z710_9BACT|nr:MAG: hypothetical protein A2777_02440 [Candidatus Gottesmanbacteria bacterium RIFCSPHIGHO2_01_FULL_40_15]OGG16542.1 MAG: hypothetical protein A3D05_05805 [Candidatus Gottesmanbacteria bacterium RIFCSPHIGHO2_02_FULL_40_24]OGG22619.1 MAG: hypothetical protein A3B48_02285 [Candidatus Gottesmanbacteria bacterium RIFCSPLOWO2_01_FULL_40_10]OGG25656.1 MAG: hypothetical protein A3E42_04960 [Candidatus Gottesmanbacteria bacterium RIFCSPHIGHO2_12_FULL_40_13]OGG32657.1 MAG: hypothetical protein A3I80_0